MARSAVRVRWRDEASPPGRRSARAVACAGIGQSLVAPAPNGEWLQGTPGYGRGSGQVQDATAIAPGMTVAKLSY